VPGLLALRDREPPVKQIAHVCEDLRGACASCLRYGSWRVVRSAAQSFAGTVGDGGDGVAKKLPRGIGCWGASMLPSSSRVATEEFKRRDAEYAEKKRRESPHPEEGSHAGYCLL